MLTEKIRVAGYRNNELHRFSDQELADLSFVELQQCIVGTGKGKYVVFDKQKITIKDINGPLTNKNGAVGVGVFYQEEPFKTGYEALIALYQVLTNSS